MRCEKKKVARTIVPAAGAIGLVLATAFSASAHGYTTKPISRAYYCNLGEAKNCGEVQYEPQSVEGLKGFPEAGPPDGHICAAGKQQWSPLDDPRGGTWPTNHVASGQRYDFQWHLTKIHATTSFRYFVTKPNWDPTKPLTRADLEPAPFLEKDFGGTLPPQADVHIDGTMPKDRHGQALILAVWDIANTPNAFYQCSDVTFG